MIFSKAWAQEAAADLTTQIPNAPSAGEAFAWNMGLVLVLVVMFYILLIRPQQKRLKEHTDMLKALEKGDTVITGGGLVGKIDKFVGEDQVVIDLGGSKVTALRSTISGKNDPRLKGANDDKPATEKKPAASKATKKKAPAKKKTAEKK